MASYPRLLKRMKQILDERGAVTATQMRDILVNSGWKRVPSANAIAQVLRINGMTKYTKNKMVFWNKKEEDSDAESEV